MSVAQTNSKNRSVQDPNQPPDREQALDTSAALDLVHLSRQTMGDNKLEREILAMFSNQCEVFERSLTVTDRPQQLAEIAHQMKGCAKSVGAWQVAKEAGKLEENPTQLQLIAPLREQIHRVEAFIRSMT